MAHFAKLGANGKVIQVLTMDIDKMLNADGVEDETVGQQWLETHNNWPAQMWIQTSYNTAGNQHKLGGTPFRGNYAGIGYEWDEDDNIFWPKKPFPSWVKDTTTASWKSPIGDAPELTDEQKAQNQPTTDAEGNVTAPATHKWYYVWNEANQSWDLTDGNA